MMPNSEWRIYENPEPDVIHSFTITDTSDLYTTPQTKLLNDTNIWQIVDQLISMGMITSAATVRSTTPAQDYEVERPVEEV